jgi:hypothetical protein
LPYIKDGDKIISQSTACFLYLGRKYNMNGKNEEELIQVEELLSEVYDLRNKLVGFCYDRHSSGNSAVSDEDRCKLVISDIINADNGIFQKLELVLTRQLSRGRDGSFLVGDSATGPDFHLWECLDHTCDVSHYYSLPNPLLGFPLLRRFKSQFAALPQNAYYLSTPLATLPHNAKVAKSFGATPSGDKWVQGMKYDFANVGGVYDPKVLNVLNTHGSVKSGL